MTVYCVLLNAVGYLQVIAGQGTVAHEILKARNGKYP
jgi:threonine dehydratase